MGIDQKHLRFEFERLFGREPRLFRAPGRVNLIGEHTDYNGGFVLPMAIDRETVVASAAKEDRKIRVRSINLDEEGEVDLNSPEQKLRGSWLDFVEGMARVIEREGLALRGADLLILSDVPTGSGLSSSAALEISLGLALTAISGHEIDRLQLAKAGQTAEHEFVGAKVGIMDQYISALGKAGHALLIDCRELTATQVPFVSDEVSIVICNTNVSHKNADSAYNTRRSECERGVKLLQMWLPDITQLRDVSITDFEQHADELPDVIRRRCKHVITENERTVKAADLLANTDWAGFGRSMRESHASLQFDYEVSCRELDILVGIADETVGVLGSRMTGGGFGGCTVSLVQNHSVETFTDNVLTQYEQQSGIKPTIYHCRPSPGASEILGDVSSSTVSF